MIRRAPVALFVALVLLAGCGSDDKEAAPTTTAAAKTTTTTAATSAETLEILVTNDDGYASEGIDAVVEALRAMPGTHVTVVAPFENKSGTGDKTTPGALVTHDVKTASGYDAIGVEGFPADTVIQAIDVLKLQPHLVVSGTNEGQNIGPFTEISGTVGAAKQAVLKGIPAFASSTGLVKDHDLDHDVAAKIVVDWVHEHRAALLERSAPVEIRNLNVPTCLTGKLRGVVEVPLATDFKGRDASIMDCTSTKPESALVDDVDAFANGFAPITLAPSS
jgi:5'-nucleotidase